jgi:hypothetical protein
MAPVLKDREYEQIKKNHNLNTKIGIREIVTG